MLLQSIIFALLALAVTGQKHSTGFDCFNTLVDPPSHVSSSGRWILIAAVNGPGYADDVYILHEADRQISVKELADMDNGGGFQFVIEGPLRIVNRNREKTCTPENNFVLVAIDPSEYPSFTYYDHDVQAAETFAHDVFILAPHGITYLELLEYDDLDIYGGLRKDNEHPLYGVEDSRRNPNPQFILFDSLITLTRRSLNKPLLFSISSRQNGGAGGLSRPSSYLTIASTTSQLYSHLLFVDQNVPLITFAREYFITAQAEWSFNTNDHYLILTGKDGQEYQDKTFDGSGKNELEDVFNAIELRVQYIGSIEFVNKLPTYNDRFVFTLFFEEPRTTQTAPSTSSSTTTATTTAATTTVTRLPSTSTTTIPTTTTIPARTSTASAITTTVRTTTAANYNTTQAANTAGTQAPPSNSDYCQCVYDSIWLDIVFVVDVSNDMTQIGVTNVAALIQSVLYQMTLGSDRFQSRVGVVSYSRDASVVYNFGQLNSADDVDDLIIDYTGDIGSNIKSGISSASVLLNNQVAGRNAKKVIVVIASAYKDGDADDPVQLADAFKNSGGQIITLEYIQPGDDTIPKLKEIASPGFYFSNTDGQFSADSFLDAFCQANCFCAPKLSAYSTNAQQTPDGGCYEYVNLAAVYRAAKSSCSRKTAMLATIHDSAKNAFLLSLLPPRQPYWIGLESTGGTYTWLDGVDYSSSYQSWADDEPSMNGGECVTNQMYSGFVTGWFATACMKSNTYFCQSQPCDSTHYCL